MALVASRTKTFLETIANNDMKFRDFLGAVGAFVTAYIGAKFAVSTVRGLWTHVASRLWPRNFIAEYGGSWAVVTGPTRGIGRSYAVALARRGLNVALIGRDPVRLGAVRDEVLKCGVKCECFEVDFAIDDPNAIETKLAKLVDLDIGILVNNVGWRNSQGPQFFVEMDKSVIWPCITVNCLSVAVMMRLVLPGMLARKKGAIVNISSLAAVHPLQLNSLFSASKAFCDFVSRATRLEVCWSGITVQTLTPSFVYTGPHYYHKQPSAWVPTTDRFVNCALATLGFSSLTAGYPLHDIELFLLNLFGESFHRAISAKIMWSRRSQFLKEQSGNSLANV